MSRNDRRPEGWTSADAAGLAIFPGLIRYDEAFGAARDHARVPRDDARQQRLRLAGVARRRHERERAADGRAPAPEGVARTSPAFTPEVQRIFRAMKRYGLIVADNGSDMYISGTMDARWNNDVLNPAFSALTADDFEVVQLGWQRRRCPRRRRICGFCVTRASRVRDSLLAAALQIDVHHGRNRSGRRVAFVKHRFQKQSGGRRGQRRWRRWSRSRRRAAARRRPVQLLRPTAASTPTMPAHHLPEEVRALHADQDQRAGLGDLEPTRRARASTSRPDRRR